MFLSFQWCLSCSSNTNILSSLTCSLSDLYTPVSMPFLHVTPTHLHIQFFVKLSTRLSHQRNVVFCVKWWEEWENTEPSSVPNWTGLILSERCLPLRCCPMEAHPLIVNFLIYMDWWWRIKVFIPSQAGGKTQSAHYRL